MAEGAALAIKISEKKGKESASVKLKENPDQSPNSLVDRLFGLQETVGNQAVQRMIRSGTLQAKLKIGKPNDKYEQEADRVSNIVIRQSESITVRKKVEEQDRLHRLQPAEESSEQCQTKRLSGEDQKGLIQSKSYDTKLNKPTGNLDSIIRFPRMGSPLAPNVRGKIEPVLRTDLSNVRVHNDVAANEAAKSIQAKAFTHRNHIWLGAGQSLYDVQLLAHESTHVLQQQGHLLRRFPDTNYIQRATIKNASGKPVSYEFRIGTEVTQAFVSLAQRLAKDGEINKADLMQLRNHALSVSETVRDTERMFMAGLLDPANVKILLNTVVKPGAAIVFPLRSISKARIEEIINLDRPSFPADILKQWQALFDTIFPSTGMLQQSVSQPMYLGNLIKGMNYMKTTLSVIELELMAFFEIMRQAGPNVFQADSLVNFVSSKKDIEFRYVLMAMIAAASDSTPADKVMAGIVYAVAASVDHPLKNYFLMGRLKVDALSPENFPTVTGVQKRAAGYVLTPTECFRGRVGCGLKGDTFYVRTNLDIENTYHRSMIIHELEHAYEDMTASKGAFVYREQLGMEQKAYGAQARFLINTMLKQNRAQWYSTVLGIINSGISDFIVWYMFYEAMAAPDRYVDVLTYVCKSILRLPFLKRNRILKELKIVGKKEEIFKKLEKVILKTYGAKTITLTGLSGESFILNYIQQQWDPNEKGVFWGILRGLSEEERQDKSIERFIKMNLESDDKWLALNLFKYGTESGTDSRWPLHLRIEREMRCLSDSRGKGAVFAILRDQHRTGAWDLLTEDELAAVRATLRDIFVAGSDDLWLALNIMDYGPEDQWPAHLERERMIKGMSKIIDYSVISITAEEASVMPQDQLQGELNKMRIYFKQQAPLTALYDVISKNINVLEEELANRKLELETARKDYKSIYDGFMVAAEDNYGNLLVRNSDGTTFTISAWKEKLRFLRLPKPRPGTVVFKHSVNKFLDPIRRYYPDPIYYKEAPKFYDQLNLIKKSPNSLTYTEINLRLEQINSVLMNIGDTEPIYYHLLKESSILLGIVKKQAKELKEKTRAIRENPEHVDNNIAHLDIALEGLVKTGTFIDFVYIKVTYKNGNILWLSLTYSKEKKIWKMKESKGQSRFVYLPRIVPSELKVDTAPNIHRLFYQKYPYVYGKRVQQYLRNWELFSYATVTFSEILSMNLMGLNPTWAALYLGYEGITGKRVFHPKEEVPTWERILNITMLTAPLILKRLKFRRPKMPKEATSEISTIRDEIPARWEKGKLIHTKNKRELIIDSEHIIRYKDNNYICRPCNPDYYHLKGGQWRRKPGVELPGKQKVGEKVDFSKIANKQAVPYNPEVPASKLGLDSSQLSKFGPYTNSEGAVNRILRKKTLDGIKGQLAEEVVNTIGTSEAAKIKPKFTEKGSTMKYFRGDEVAAPAPKQKSAGAERANITDGITAEIYSEGGREKIYIHRLYEVKSGAPSAQKLGVQVAWDRERIKELGISVKVPKPGGGFTWKEFAPQDISMVPTLFQTRGIKGFFPTGVKVPTPRPTGRYQAFELPGFTETDLIEAALMILRQKGGGH